MKISFVKNGEALCDVVVAVDADAAVIAEAERIRAAISEATGAELSPVGCIHDTEAGRTQIVVGTTAPAFDAAVMRDVTFGQYAVRYSAGRVHLAGWDIDETAAAVDDFIAVIRENATGENLTVNAPDSVKTSPLARSEKPWDKFTLTYFFGPTAAEIAADPAVARRIADAGFTCVQLAETHMGRGGLMSDQDIFRALDILTEQGMEISFFLTSSLSRLTSLTDDKLVSQSEVDAVVAEIIKKYGGYKNIVEWYLRDEPSTEQFKAMAMVTDAFHRLDPTRPTVTNLLPGITEKGYRDYIGGFLEKVDADSVSFDRYRFVGEPARLESRTYFDSMWVVRHYAAKYGLPATMIALSTKHQSYSYLREEQLRWEANVALAYGYKTFSYFTYHAWDDGGLVDWDGNPTEQYHFVKNLARDVVPVGRYLARQSFEMVFHFNTIETLGAPKYISYGSLGKVGGKDAVIGFFGDGSFYIVNYRFESDAGLNTLHLYDLADAEWFDPSDAAWKCAGSCPLLSKAGAGLALSLAPGDGILLRAAK